MINIIIFSKDRACQLDALLRSLKDNMRVPHKVTVLYKVSNEEYLKGYYTVIGNRINPVIDFVRESDFKKNLIDIYVPTPEYPLSMFFVDDNILKEPLVEDNLIKEFYEDANVFSLSTRLGRNTEYCYPVSRHTGIPNIVNNRYNRNISDGDWSYVWSVDGNIYRTRDLINYVGNFNYHNPNEFEGYMGGNIETPLFMMCFEKSKTINIPCNRVQDAFPNRNGGLYTPEELNYLYLSGKRIKLQPIYEINNNACHIEYKYLFE